MLDEVHQPLLRAIPEQGPATIVHGDYRLDNCMVAADGQIIAVLDWEICTLGDPAGRRRAADGLLDRPRRRRRRPASAGATTLDGFLRRGRAARALRRRCPAATCPPIDYYVAFGYWKLACIIEGVYARYMGGAMGHRGGERRLRLLRRRRSSTLVESARQAIGRLE